MRSREADYKEDQNDVGWVDNMLMTHRVRGGKMPSEPGDVWVFPGQRTNDAGQLLTFLLHVSDDTLFEVLDQAGNSLGYSTLADFTRGSGCGAGGTPAAG
ncbi:MAG: hypothetical protein FJ164_11810 [Gammaproteobacteria bacterium]|nr:hypothetical protein [Gammaproteobacteria bacterium]